MLRRVISYPFICPLLVGVFFVLSLYSRNIDGIPIGDIVVPLVFVVLLALVFYFVPLLIFRKYSVQIGVFSVLVVLAILCYGYLPNPIGNYVLRVWFFGFVGCVFVVLLWRRPSWKVSLLFNVVAVSLLVSPLFTITLHQAGDARNSDLFDVAVPQLEDTGHKPDIYYLIFDRYTSLDVLEDLGYDNSGFIGELESRGFLVPKTYANYTGSMVSLSSSLNMSYLGPRYMDEKSLNTLLEGNVVLQALQDVGYYGIHVGSWWRPTANNRYADENRTYTSLLEPNEFSLVFWRTTLLYYLKVTHDWLGLDTTRNFTAYQFGTLKTIPAMEEPTYTFAHILVPHDPWVFNRDGSEPSAEESASRTYVEKYIEQLIYANGRILELVDVILASSPDSIIILQADEGLTSCSEGLDVTDMVEVRQRTSILNAYHVPGMEIDENPVTPVNTFRRVFNYYFGADLEFLENKVNYLTRDRPPYEYSDVTELLLEVQ